MVTVKALVDISGQKSAHREGPGASPSGVAWRLRYDGGYSEAVGLRAEGAVAKIEPKLVQLSDAELAFNLLQVCMCTCMCTCMCMCMCTCMCMCMCMCMCVCLLRVAHSL